MVNAREVIVKPLITEKTMKLMEQHNTMTFVVAKGTNKIQIRQAIKKLFNVDAVSINTVNVRPKKKRVGKYSGFVSGYKKAVVKIAEGQDIDLGL